jgi:hypothetical protein
MPICGNPGEKSGSIGLPLHRDRDFSLRITARHDDSLSVGIDPISMSGFVNINDHGTGKINQDPFEVVKVAFDCRGITIHAVGFEWDSFDHLKVW